MLLYLVQHGTAKSEEEDPARPLTDEGRREVEAIALLAMRFGALTAARVVHSGKRRAAETAELIADKLEAECEEADGLGPKDDPAVWARRLTDQLNDLVLVGHLPHLDRLASLLLCGDPDAGVVAFTNAGIVCLAREDDGQWRLRWAITPDLVVE